MGSCGSYLNCNKCYSSTPIKGCDTEIDINPDIAGLGVLISFYFSAIAISAIIIWGYWTESLPSDLLTATDHYTLQCVKKLGRAFVEADVNFRPSSKQEKRREVITGFIKVLSDQQLVTGFAILVAGLASRCQISIYEFNIVTYLAYFAIFTHSISLVVVRGYLYRHTFVRNCRVIFTIVFLILFSFSFVVNTASDYFEDVVQKTTLNVGNPLQCVFDAPKFGKTIQFDIVGSIFVLGFIVFNHGIALSDLYLAPPENTLARLSYSWTTRYLCDRGLSAADAHEVIMNAERKHDAWFRPTRTVTHKSIGHISIWYILEEYYNSYISLIPTIFMGIGYGTASTSTAVWSGGLEPVNGLQILGFGQIVAVALLALTLLAAAEIVNEQKVLETKASSSIFVNEMNTGNATETEHRLSEESRHSLDNHRAPPSSKRFDRCREFLVRLWVRKTTEDLHEILAGKIATYDDDPETARKIGLFSFLYGFIEICLFTYLGIDFALYDNALAVLIAYLGYRLILLRKKFMAQDYFLRIEIGVQNAQQLPNLQQESVRSNNRHSSNPVSSPVEASTHSSSPPTSQASSVAQAQHPTAMEGQRQFSSPGRQDTEADLGLIMPMRRRTFPLAVD